MSTLAAIELILTLLEKGPALVRKLKDIGKQTGELSAEDEAKLDAKLEAMFQSDAWKIE